MKICCQNKYSFQIKKDFNFDGFHMKITILDAGNIL